MQRLTKDRMPGHANRELPHLVGRYANVLWMLLLAGTMIMFSGCGGSSSGNPQQIAGTLSGNWQFTMATQTDGNQGDPTFGPSLQGGFLLQSNNVSASGQAVYSVMSSSSVTGPCNSGSATITVTISGQNVTITAVAGTQTFTLSGTLSTDGSTMMGTYTSTAGTAADGSPCGYAITAAQALSWSAISVPPLTGTIQGSFHSTGGLSNLGNQDFPVTGTFTQGENIGASNATITGTLSFLNPTTNVSDYPCLAMASVNGQISGTFVILQIIGINGSVVGQIGAPAGSSGSTGVNTVAFESVSGGYVLHGLQSYIVASSGCPGSLSNTIVAGDYGNICLQVNGTAACQQPVTLSPALLSFPAQMLGTASAPQTITLANNSTSTLNSLTLTFTLNPNVTLSFPPDSDFNGLPDFTETDACGPGGTASNGAPFNLSSGQSCAISVSFSPEESCPWLPFPAPPSLSGAPPEWCPFPQSALITATVSAASPLDSDKNFAVPITGIGLSAVFPSTPELDFGAEEQFNPPESSLPQMLSFTNNSANPVQILSSVPCVNPPKGSLTHPNPVLSSSPIAGLLVVANGQGIANSITPDGSTFTYECDVDPGTLLPNFQISSDDCSGTLLAPQASCSLQVTYIPQPNTDVNFGLDYFLELNTIQCSKTVTSDCEIDSGRFPVELKANTPSPLRMTPSAGLDFGTQAMGKSSTPLQITLLNDPNLTATQTVTFVGRITAPSNYSETDDCTPTLAPGSSCTLTIQFKPGGKGFLPGTMSINYSTPTLQNVPQKVYLRGTGQ